VFANTSAACRGAHSHEPDLRRALSAAIHVASVPNPPMLVNMLTVRSISLSGYRSLQSVTMRLDRLNVFAGPNGAGKTNLYRGMQLSHAAANGTFAREIAGEGGMEAALWAGRRQRRAPARIVLSAELAPSAGGCMTYTYELAAGVPQPSAAAFPLEPQIKSETMTFHDGNRRHVLLERHGPSATLRDEHGVSHAMSRNLLASETALAAIDDPGAFPDQHLLRQTLAAWRFYHDLRTDAASPLRSPCLAVTSTSLDADGGNLAAVFATLEHIRGDRTDLDTAIDHAFPGSRLHIPMPAREANFGMTYPEFELDGGARRLFEARELSDGTIRFLGLAGALHAYHPPPLIALNEPEGSLHPDLMGPLADMIVSASNQSQIWVVTHATALAKAMEDRTGLPVRQVRKINGATTVE